MVFVCKDCHFLFDDSGRPERCPDCGHTNIRPASIEEEAEFVSRAKIDFWADDFVVAPQDVPT